MKSKCFPTKREMAQMRRIYGNTDRLQFGKNGSVRILGRTC